MTLKKRRERLRELSEMASNLVAITPSVLDALLDALDAAEEALEPFAEEAARWDSVALTQRDLDIIVPIDSRIGDFKRACGALAIITGDYDNS